MVVILGCSGVGGLVVLGVDDGLEVRPEGSIVKGGEKFRVEELGRVLRAGVDLHSTRGGGRVIEC